MNVHKEHRGKEPSLEGNDLAVLLLLLHQAAVGMRVISKSCWMKHTGLFLLLHQLSKQSAEP